MNSRYWGVKNGALPALIYFSMVNFGYVIRLYPAGEAKNFEDAKGQVISDYQAFLEEKWINQLKKKYPVKIYDEVVRSLASN